MTPIGEFTPNEFGGRSLHRQVLVSREHISYRDVAEVTRRLQAFNDMMYRELDAPIGGGSTAVARLGAD